MLFASAFRFFFLMTGLYAILGILAWLFIHHGVIGLPLAYPPMLWHGHEMIFGFAAAGLAGFILTAIPNWTNTPHPRGAKLYILAGAWTIGRIGIILSGVVPPLLVAISDLLFLPLLLAQVILPIIRAKETRNYIFPPLLLLAFIGNIFFHLEAIGIKPWGMTGLQIGLYVLCALIAIVGGRVIPFFTNTGFERANDPRRTWKSDLIEKLAVPLIGLCLLGEIFLADNWLGGIIFLATAFLHAVRLWGWCGFSTVGNILLFILHIGYGWLVFGLALRGFANFLPLSSFAAHHALTIGAAATLLLGMMTRASLWHSGRPLILPRLAIAAYGLVTLSALVRVGVQILAPQLHYGMGVGLSGLLWILAFLSFVVAYFPIFISPRADGKEG